MVPAEDFGVICQGPNDPVDKALEHGVQQAVAEVEQEWPGVPAALLEIDTVGQFAMVVLELVGQAASPDGRPDEGDGEDPDEPPLPAAGEAEVEEVADAGGAEHLRAPVEDVVEALGADREEGAVDVVELVGVEEVARPGGGEHEQHPPVGEELEDLGALGGRRGEGDPGGLGAVAADDPGRRQDEDGERGADEHEGHEADVGAVVDADGLLVVAVVVEGEGEEAAEDAAEVEEAPEEGDVGAPAVGRRVGGHDGALRRPEEAGAGAEDGAGRDGEGLGGVVVVVEEGAGVERVGEGAQQERDARAEEVVRGAAEDAEDGEAGVEGGVGVVGGVVVDLAAAAEAGERVEHARAAEADEAQQGHLRQRRVVPEEAALCRHRRRRGLHLRHGHCIVLDGEIKSGSVRMHGDDEQERGCRYIYRSRWI